MPTSSGRGTDATVQVPFRSRIPSSSLRSPLRKFMLMMAGICLPFKEAALGGSLTSLCLPLSAYPVAQALGHCKCWVGSRDLFLPFFPPNYHIAHEQGDRLARATPLAPRVNARRALR